MADINSILKKKGTLSKDGTKETKYEVKNIHYSQLVSNTKQIYAEKDIEELADMIELAGGIKQALAVRKLDADRYEIVAGHRRWRACTMLVEKRGLSQFALLPCHVEMTCNDWMAEYLLITTNGYRTKSDYERMMEVVRLKEVIPHIPGKEDLKGRMLRKEIAKKMGRGEITVQNLSFIAAHLIPEGMDAFRDQKMGVSVAYRIAQQPEEDQKDLIRQGWLTLPEVNKYLAAKEEKEKREHFVSDSDTGMPEKENDPTVSESDTGISQEELNMKKCVTGWSKSGRCGAAQYCSEPVTCCKNCNENCNIRCGWLPTDKIDINETEIDWIPQDTEDEKPKNTEWENHPSQMTIEEKAPEAVPEEIQQENKPSDQKTTTESTEGMAKEMLEALTSELVQMEKNLSPDDPEIRKKNIMVEGLRLYLSNNQKQSVHKQPELPILKNTEERKNWLQSYKEWGVWYVDPHTGATYYKYDFDNGATLIAETYDEPANEYHIAYNLCYFHLVGGPKPQKGHYGVKKWAYHTKYVRQPNSETEVIEFLKYCQEK